MTRRARTVSAIGALLVGAFLALMADAQWWIRGTPYDDGHAWWRLPFFAIAAAAWGWWGVRLWRSR